MDRDGDASITGEDLLEMDKADDIWQCIQRKVVTGLCGPGATPVPHLHDAHMFRPLCVIGKRVEGSTRMRKVRSLFPLGSLQNLLDDPEHQPEASMQTEGPLPCDFIYEEFLDGVGRVRVQVSHLTKEMAVCPLAPHQQLTLKENLPWLDSVHRLYLISQTYCSPEVRLRLLGSERRTELRLGPNTPLAFSCLRLSVSPSGLVEVCTGWEGTYLNPRARWARFGSPDYASLVEGKRGKEPRAMGMFSQFAFQFSHPLSALSLPTSAILMDYSSQDLQPIVDFQAQQEMSTQALLSPDNEEEKLG